MKLFLNLISLIFLFYSSAFAGQEELLSSNRTDTTQLLVFVSLSMPPKSLKLWMEEAQRIKAPLLIRGLMHNSFKETAFFVKALLQKKSGGFLIDPLRFKQYSITEVPTVVVIDSDKNWDSISGDVHLDYALNYIAQRTASSAIQTQLTSFIKILRGQRHDDE